MKDELKKEPAHKVIIEQLIILDDKIGKLVAEQARAEPEMELAYIHQITFTLVMLGFGGQAIGLYAVLAQMHIPQAERRWVGGELRKMRSFMPFLAKQPPLLKMHTALIEELDPEEQSQPDVAGV